jgi:hypothetical protein
MLKVAGKVALLAKAPVIIIGGGIGGLTCALDLASSGVEVILVEKEAQVGGKIRQINCSNDPLKPSPIDSGPTVFTMRWVFDALFEKAGTSLESELKLGKLNILARHAWNKDERLDLFSDIEQSAQAFAEFSSPEEAKIMDVWLLGERKVIETLPLHDIRGKYNLLVDDKQFPIEISGTTDKLVAKVVLVKKSIDSKSDTLLQNSYVQLVNNDVTIQFNVEDKTWNGSVNLHGQVNSKLGIFEGDGTIPTGKWIKWSAIKNAKNDTEIKEEIKASTDSIAMGKVWFPNMAYGFDSLPGKQTLLIKNATVWTNEAEGILKNATIIAENGKITYVGNTGSYTIPQNVKVINAEGKHVTCGIIDEHSHIAISKGVNESGQTITAEVNIGDVVTSDDISIYRQLAGGVTAAQLLHGSSNTIGGQSALIKLKWGHNVPTFLAISFSKFPKLGVNLLER